MFSLPLETNVGELGIYLNGEKGIQALLLAGSLRMQMYIEVSIGILLVHLVLILHLAHLGPLVALHLYLTYELVPVENPPIRMSIVRDYMHLCVGLIAYL